MRRLFLMIGMCVVFARPSGADVLTFEGLTTAQAVDLTAGNQGYGGFTWDAGWSLYRGDVYHPPGSFGDYGIVNNFGNDPLGFSAGRPFSVTSLRIARWSFNAPDSVRIVAYDAARHLVGDTGAIAVGPAFRLVTANFTDVSRVEFLGGHFFALDNVMTSLAPTPEPGSIALLAMGVVALGVRRARASAGRLRTQS
jgi:hypothetical protein